MTQDQANDTQEHDPLRQIIIQHIMHHPRNAIPFCEYMELCLYHREYGYYSKSKTKVGKEGDFYTSASIGTIMGEMVAEMFMHWAAQLPDTHSVTLVEWGGGDGKLAGQLLDQVKRRNPELYARTRLIMVEYSTYHRKLQREQLAMHGNVRWMDEEEWRRGAPWKRVFVWANELLDAFPVHRVRMLDNGPHEIWVGWDEKNARYKEVYIPVDDHIAEYMAKHQIKLQTGQTGELNLHAEKWMMQMGQHIADGHLTVIDYGDEAAEIYAPHRMEGTLMCYRQHQASDQPYEHVGGQDMTAHVDFTACQHAAEEAGFQEIRLETQMAYLLRGGILDWLQEHYDPDPFSPKARRNRAIRQLLLSDQMSELFKVMTAVKPIRSG